MGACGRKPSNCRHYLFAQDQLGAIVGVGLPDEDADVEKGSELADLDSMKTADQILRL